jgi:hypothetical protein
MSTPATHHHHPRPDGFARVALWQFLAFLLMLLLVWVNEVLDLSSLWFGTAPAPPNWLRGCILSIGVLVTAIVAVGHTYIQQKRIIRGLLTVCSYCHKIRIEHEVWEQMDSYLCDHSLAVITHGMCPVCFERMQQELKDLKQT